MLQEQHQRPWLDGPGRQAVIRIRLITVQYYSLLLSLLSAYSSISIDCVYLVPCFSYAYFSHCMNRGRKNKDASGDVVSCRAESLLKRSVMVLMFTVHDDRDLLQYPHTSPEGHMPRLSPCVM